MYARLLAVYSLDPLPLHATALAHDLDANMALCNQPPAASRLDGLDVGCLAAVAISLGASCQATTCSVSAPVFATWTTRYRCTVLAVAHGPHVPFHVCRRIGNLDRQRDTLLRLVPERPWPDEMDKVVQGVNRTMFWNQRPSTDYTFS